MVEELQYLRGVRRRTWIRPRDDTGKFGAALRKPRECCGPCTHAYGTITRETLERRPIERDDGPRDRPLAGFRVQYARV